MPTPNENRPWAHMLACITLVVASLAAVTPSQDTGDRATQADQARRTVKPRSSSVLTPPAKPDAVKGRWNIGGRKYSITEGEFYEAQKLLTALEGTANQAVTSHRIWEHILLDAESMAMGIVVTQKDVDDALNADDQDLYEGMMRRWETSGITAEQGREFTASQQRVQQLKDLHLNSQRITTQDAFDIFKINHLKYQLEYVMFAAEDHLGDLDPNGIDDLTLRTFWSRNKVVQNSFRTPNSVSAEFIFLDPGEYSLEKAMKIMGDRKVTRGQALDYFESHMGELMRQIPPDRQHLLIIGDDTPLDEIVTPFSILENTIKKTLLLEGVVGHAHEKTIATGAGADMEAIARDLQLGYMKIEDMGRAKTMTNLRRFGVNLFNTLNALPNGTISPKVLDERGVSYIFRLNERKVSRLPAFEEIKGEIKERYLDMMGTAGARKASQQVIRYMTKKADDALKEERGKLEQAAVIKAEKRIEFLGITDEAERNREMMRARASIHQEIEKKKKTLLPKFFEEYLKDHGLKTETTEYFELQPLRSLRDKNMTRDELRKLFVRRNYYLRSMQPGEVTPIMLEDPSTKSFFIIRLLGRRDPDIATMGPVDLMQARAQATQRAEDTFMQRWRFPMVSRRVGLKTTNN